MHAAPRGDHHGAVIGRLAEMNLDWQVPRRPPISCDVSRVYVLNTMEAVGVSGDSANRN
jgi:hypothetical protein